MAFIPFKKSNKCVITDDLFLEITWEDGKSPDDDSELLGIIKGLDQQYLDTFPQSIEESLPYLTFFQAEHLFQTLRDTYGQLQLKKLLSVISKGKRLSQKEKSLPVPLSLIERIIICYYLSFKLL